MVKGGEKSLPHASPVFLPQHNCQGVCKSTSLSNGDIEPEVHFDLKKDFRTWAFVCRDPGSPSKWLG